MWTLHTQFSKPQTESNSKELEWSSLQVDTKEEAEAWWKTRTAGLCNTNRVSTMFDPNGKVVNVKFN